MTFALDGTVTTSGPLPDGALDAVPGRLFGANVYASTVVPEPRTGLLLGLGLLGLALSGRRPR